MQVLVHIGAVELPSCLVKKRWTISAREGVVCSIAGYTDAAATLADAASMHGLLHAAAMELVCMGTTSRQAFEVAVDYVSHAKAAISAMTVSDRGLPRVSAQTALEGDTSVLHFDSAIAAPPRVRSRGRPKELRFKSPIESPGARKRPSSTPLNKPVEGTDRTRRSTRFLKTGVYLVEHCGTCDSTQHQTSDCSLNAEAEQVQPTRRRCQSCGEVGHNRSTCGRKSTYIAK
jgi:hypothetical protein